MRVFGEDLAKEIQSSRIIKKPRLHTILSASGAKAKLRELEH